jgi:hypothetical protein
MLKQLDNISAPEVQNLSPRFWPKAKIEQERGEEGSRRYETHLRSPAHLFYCSFRGTGTGKPQKE